MTSSNVFRRESIQRRLERLETSSAFREEDTVPQLGPARLVAAILAVCRGILQPEEAMSEGYARALGYDRSRELRTDLQHDPAAVQRVQEEVWHELLRREGIALAAITMDDLERLYEVVPDDVKRRLHLPYASDAFL